MLKFDYNGDLLNTNKLTPGNLAWKTSYCQRRYPPNYRDKASDNMEDQQDRSQPHINLLKYCSIAIQS